MSLRLVPQSAIRGSERPNAWRSSQGRYNPQRIVLVTPEVHLNGLLTDGIDSCIIGVESRGS